MKVKSFPGLVILLVWVAGLSVSYLWAQVFNVSWEIGFYTLLLQLVICFIIGVGIYVDKGAKYIFALIPTSIYISFIPIINEQHWVVVVGERNWFHILVVMCTLAMSYGFLLKKKKSNGS